MQCSRCQADNQAGRKFCRTCGQALPVPCAQCSFVNELGDQFCGGCGQPFTVTLSTQPPTVVSSQLPVASSQSPAAYTPPHLAERILAEQAALEARGAANGERKTITALF